MTTPKDPALDIIEQEIKRLKELSQTAGLDLNETKRFEILVKSRALILGKSTSAEDELHSDVSVEELLNVISFPKQ
jgi:hypothetical protein